MEFLDEIEHGRSILRREQFKLTAASGILEAKLSKVDLPNIGRLKNKNKQSPS